MKLFIKILKIILGIILGLVFSFLTIVGLDAIFPTGNPFGKNTLNLWCIAPIVAGWLFLMLWLMLNEKSAKKLKTSGIEDLPTVISEYIDNVITAMKYRRSVRVEVRQELTDHFTDALAGCKDEQEKETCIKELIEGFGDVKLLGTLLRRAKKRCRPLWRTMVVRAFQFVGICFVLLILYIGWFFTGTPKVTTNYLEIMNQRVRPVAEDSQNAWPYYKEAAEGYIEPAKMKIEIPPSNEGNDTGSYEEIFSSADEENFDQSPRKLELLSGQERSVLQQWIADNEKSLELIHQGNQRPYYWPTYSTGNEGNTEIASVLLPHLNEYRRLAKLICWQALLNAEQSDYEKALDDVLEVYSFGQHLRSSNTSLINQLVAYAIEALSTNTMRELLNEQGDQIDAVILNSGRKRFSKMIANEDFIVDYEGEKLFMYDEAQRCFTQSRFGKSHLYFPRLSKLMGSDLDELFGEWRHYGFQIFFTHPDKEETLRQVDRLFSEMEKKAAMTPASAHAQDITIEPIVQEIIQNNLFMSVLMPALTKVSQLAWGIRTQTEATLVILALIQYEKQHGEYPESLDVLVDEGLLKEVPIDPFSDKPLVYRTTDDDFILYSVGYDFTDNGGKIGTGRKGQPVNNWEDGDYIFWPVE